MAPSTTLTTLAILSLVFCSTTPQMVAPSIHSNALEVFIRCHDSNFPKNTTFTPNTTSYNTIFLSSIQNHRFLSSTATKPIAIVTTTTESDVQRVVICAQNYGIQLRVRSGGHDYEGLSSVSPSNQHFALVDLTNIRTIELDPREGTAWVGAGATIGEVYYNIALKNKTAAFPAGLCPTVGVGGHFSGGGIGALMRKYGVSADNIVDAQLVDINGSLTNLGTQQTEDVFWAIRGGGATSFGIITSYQIKLVHVPPKVTTFDITKTLREGATHLVERWQHVAPKLDDNVFIMIIARAIDDKEAKANHTIQVIFRCLFLGESAELLPLMNKSFPELQVEVKDLKEMTWIESVTSFASLTNVTQLLDRRPLYNNPLKAKSDFVREPISKEGWEGIWKFMLEGEGEPLMLIMDPWGGKMDEIHKSKIAFPHRKGNLYIIQYFMRWVETQEEMVERHLDWMRKLYSYMEPYVSKNPRAAYLNYKDIDLGRNEKGITNLSEASVWGRKYFLNNFDRLVAVKAKVDPDNYFWNEQSIPPLT